MAKRSNTHPFIHLRLWPAHHQDHRLASELLDTLATYPGIFDEVWFCTEIGFPEIHVHQESGLRMKTMAKAVKELGIAPGIQIGTTLGHGMTPFSVAGLTWQRFTGYDGRISEHCSCPRAESLVNYLCEIVIAYAVANPASFWLDDDLRMMGHNPVGHGCFCDACIVKFNQRLGSNFSRTDLVRQIADPDNLELREKWLQYNSEALSHIASRVAQTVREYAPQAYLGYQHSNCDTGIYNGNSDRPTFEALVQGSGRPVGARPGTGVYHDHSPREMIKKVFSMGRTIPHYPEGVEIICPEIEGFPHLISGKSPQGVAVESTLALAVGCNALSYALLCSAREPMSLYRRYLDTIQTWTPFWKQMVEDQSETRQAGLYIGTGSQLSAQKPGPNTGEKEDPGEAFLANGYFRTDFSDLMDWATLGLPLTGYKDHAQITLLHRQGVTTYSDLEIAELLKTPVLMDGESLYNLQQRGLTDTWGITIQTQEEPWAFERFTDHELNGPYKRHGKLESLFLKGPAAFSIQVDNPNAISLSSIGSHENSNLPSGVVLLTLATGSRIAVVTNWPWSELVDSARRFQYLQICDWLTHDNMPMRVHTPTQAIVIPHTDKNGRVKTVVFLNPSIGRSEPLEITVRNPSGTEPVFIEAEKKRPLPVTIENENLNFTLPAMQGWSVAYLRFECETPISFSKHPKVSDTAQQNEKSVSENHGPDMIDEV